MIKKIISGGQTGVDQAALYVAVEIGIPVGGWCPLGGFDENGTSMLNSYPLTDIKELSFEQSVVERTKRNIIDADGTLIIVPSLPLSPQITDGTLLTINYANTQEKPYLLIAINDEHAIETIHTWLTIHNINSLNVAGPRESNSPGIYDKTCVLLKQLLLFTTSHHVR